MVGKGDKVFVHTIGFDSSYWGNGMNIPDGVDVREYAFWAFGSRICDTWSIPLLSAAGFEGAGNTGWLPMCVFMS